MVLKRDNEKGRGWIEWARGRMARGGSSCGGREVAGDATTNPDATEVDGVLAVDRCPIDIRREGERKANLGSLSRETKAPYPLR